MKNLRHLCMATAVCFAVACNNSNDHKDSVDSAEHMNEQKQMNDTGTTAKVNHQAADFAVKAAAGGMMEVEFGKLAQQKGSQKVKEFGAMMVKHHGEMNEKLKKVAAAKNITLPAEISSEAKTKWDDLNKKSGKDFDKAYVDLMVDDHQKDLDFFKDNAENQPDADLRALAKEGVPVIQTHLNAVKAMKDKM
jgi:putative membrane protein